MSAASEVSLEMEGAADFARAIQDAADKGFMPYTSEHDGQRDLCWLCMKWTRDPYRHGVNNHPRQTFLWDMTGRLGLNVDPAACLRRQVRIGLLPESAFPCCRRLQAEQMWANAFHNDHKALREALQELNEARENGSDAVVLKELERYVGELREALDDEFWTAVARG